MNEEKNISKRIATIYVVMTVFLFFLPFMLKKIFGLFSSFERNSGGITAYAVILFFFLFIELKDKYVQNHLLFFQSYAATERTRLYLLLIDTQVVCIMGYLFKTFWKNPPVATAYTFLAAILFYNTMRSLLRPVLGEEDLADKATALFFRYLHFFFFILWLFFMKMFVTQ